jgi:PAT family beta-lactamase induction signal transducer AmpG
MFDRLPESVRVYLERRVLSVFFLGFSSGLPLALTFATLTFWLKEEGLTKTSIGLFASVGTPYALKFLWAPLMDRTMVPFLGRWLGRRRGWLAATQLALMAAIVGLGSTQPGINAQATALLAVIVAVCSASQDIVIDAYRVDILDDEQQAAGAAAVVFGYRIGMLMSGAGALFLASYFGWFEVYAVMAAMMLVGLVTVLFSREPEFVATAESVALERRAELYLAERPHLKGATGTALAWLYGSVVCPFAEFFSRYGRMTIAILVFVVFYKFGDTLAGVMTSPFLLEMGFTKVEIATVSKSYGLAASLAGFAIGGSLMTKVGLVRSLWICGILQLLTNFVFAIQAVVGHDLVMLSLTIGFENLAGGMGTAAFVAYLSSLCNASYTATQYALLSSLFAVPRTLLSTSAGWLADHMTWIQFFSLTAGAAVPGLILLALLSRHAATIATEARSDLEPAH